MLRFAATNNTVTGNIKGTPQYMAPEAIRGSIETKGDVYSFGAVMLEVVTGLKPLDETRNARDIVRTKFS